MSSWDGHWTAGNWAHVKQIIERSWKSWQGWKHPWRMLWRGGRMGQRRLLPGKSQLRLFHAARHHFQQKVALEGWGGSWPFLERGAWMAGQHMCTLLACVNPFAFFSPAPNFPNKVEGFHPCLFWCLWAHTVLQLMPREKAVLGQITQKNPPNPDLAPSTWMSWVSPRILLNVTIAGAGAVQKHCPGARLWVTAAVVPRTWPLPFAVQAPFPHYPPH